MAPPGRSHLQNKWPLHSAMTINNCTLSWREQSI
jgi:hypothetical protein